MGRKTFTDEQIEMLRQNPYTYSVTRLRLAFTKEFKEIFYSEYQAGDFPRRSWKTMDMILRFPTICFELCSGIT